MSCVVVSISREDGRVMNVIFVVTRLLLVTPVGGGAEEVCEERDPNQHPYREQEETPSNHVRSCCGFCSGPEAIAFAPVTLSKTLAFCCAHFFLAVCVGCA